MESDETTVCPVCGGSNIYESGEYLGCADCYRQRMQSAADARSAYIVVDSWAGRERIPVTVIGETAKRFRCQLTQDAKLPGRNNSQSAGHVFLAPKTAVVFTDKQEDSSL